MTNKEKEPTKVKELDCECSRNTILSHKSSMFSSFLALQFSFFLLAEVESKLREGPDQPMKAKDEDQQEQSTKNQTDESDCKF